MNYKFIFFIAFSLLWGQILTANNYKVIRGERPPIDYSLVEDTGYYPGVIILKVSEEYSQHLDQQPVYTDKDGLVRFGFEQLDKLNEQFLVREATQHFASNAQKNGFTEKHRAWGFHLWYRLELDEKAHIPSVIEEFQRLKEVEIAEPELVKVLIGSADISDYRVLTRDIPGDNINWIPDDPHFNNQWHYHNTGQQNGTSGADIRLLDAWGIEKGDSSVIVAIIDGGIDYSHVDLAGNMWSEIGYNFVTNSPSIEPHNHGTHVAGTISAVNNNGIGVAGIAGGSGENDGVKLMSCQVFTQDSNGGFHLAPVYAADNGAAISQNSWGYTTPGVFEQNVLDAIDYFNVNGGGDALNGGITIFAAGNSDSSEAYYPGFYSGALSVAATNNNDAKSWYSNYGSWVDISAPGGETNTVTERGVLSTLNNNQYGYYQGTSMACPHVSGVVALILSSVYGELSPEDIVEIITNTTDNHYSANPGFVGQLGTGRINAYNALALSQIYLLLPGNPVDFLAVAESDSVIQLSWNLNEEADSVVLAWSPDGIFGVPEEGNAYQAGDQISGGGVVLFAGDAREFEHSGLNASSLYFYRIWSVNDDYLYSLGRGLQEYTQCGISTLPVFEAFSHAELPYCWNLPNGQQNWRMTSNGGSPAPAIEFHWSPAVTNYSISLESPPMDGNIAGDAIALEFDLMLDNYTTATIEELHVEVFNGSEWVNVLSFDNTNGDIDWETFFVDITAHALHRTFMVRFTAEGANSFSINQWIIDNFSVYSFSCPQPVDLEATFLTTESAMISWLPLGSEENWDLVWGAPGFNPETNGNLVEGLTSFDYLLQDLTVFTDYQVYVRADCGDEDISLWSGPLDFATLATCPAPINLAVTNITGTTATVSWEPVGQETTWQLIWGPSGFHPATAGNLIEDLMDTTYQLTHLQIVTEYDVYVRSWCEEEDISVWTNPFTFSTICDAFELPFSETFSEGSTNCWTFPKGQGNWEFGNNYPPPSSASGSPYATFTWNPTRQNYSYALTSPVLHAASDFESVFLDFILFIDNYNNNSLEEMALEYKRLRDREWLLLENYTNTGLGSGSQEFQVQALHIPDMEGQLFQIRFRANGVSTFAINGWSIDDLSIYQELTYCNTPDSLNVSSITDNSAQLSWIPGGGEKGWRVLYGPEGFDVENDGILLDSILTLPLVIDDLQMASRYDYYIQAICSEDFESEWVGPASFETEITSYTLLVTYEGNGIVEPEGELISLHGSEQTITFTPNVGHHIASVWMDSVDVMDSLVIGNEISSAATLHLPDISFSHHVHVQFAVNIYSVEVTTEPEHGGTVTGAGEFPHGYRLTLSAEPANNFAFLYWKENDLEVSEALELVVDVESFRSFVAVFQDVTSINRVVSDVQNVSIYPNPAYDKLWVELYHTSDKRIKVNILSMDARRVSQLAIEHAGYVRLAFDLSDIQPGVYLLQIEGEPILRKVVIH